MTETKPDQLLKDACGVCGNEVSQRETVFVDEMLDTGKIVFHYRCYPKWQQLRPKALSWLRERDANQPMADQAS